MEIFITDNAEIYRTSTSGKKLLYSAGTIASSSFIPDNELLRFNLDLNALENAVALEMHRRLQELCQKAPEFPLHPAIRTRPVYDQAWSVLYPNFKLFLLPALILHRTVEQLLTTFQLEDHSLTFNLSKDLTLTQNEIWAGDGKKSFYFRPGSVYRVPGYKNLFYRFHSLFSSNQPKDKTKKHIVLYLFDTFNDIRLFQDFCSRLAVNPSWSLTIVQLSSGIHEEDRCDASLLKQKNVSVRYFSEFKAPIRNEHEHLLVWLSKTDSKYQFFRQIGLNSTLEIYYAYTQRSLKELQPDIVLYDNIGEHGRAISDVCRLNTIPCVNVEYGLFTDDNIHFKRNIQFTARACLGPASIELWKKRKDPSPLHAPVGFLKLDSVSPGQHNAGDLRRKYNLPSDRPILLFASTWSGTSKVYGMEKKMLVEQLSRICKRNKWLLLIKKHPAETDTILEETVKLLDSGVVYLFKHEDLDLYDAIQLSSFCSTQASSISVEALYFRKPVLFLTLSQKENMALYSIMKDEPFVFVSDNETETERVLRELLVKPIGEELYTKAIHKYLFSDDRSAYKRLLELCTTLVQK